MAAREQLARMTLEEKIGQMVMFGFPGAAPSPEIRDFIARNRIGGVILFARNCGTTAQLARLNGELQALAGQTPRKIPLFIAVDQEGGSVVRLTDGVEVFPGNMALGAARQPEKAYLAARITARDLRAAGINVNFAPVLDVNVNAANPVIGVRSFGEDPELVARLGVAAIRGYQEGGVMATGKHFPGHGDTAVDSHLALPTVPHDRRRLDEVELRPFREAIRAGVGAIMTAHVTFPAVDPAPGMPATLSRRVLTGLLRDELGFEGLIFTDCMEMKAIAGHFGSGQAAVMAIQAGADMVLVSHTPSVQQASLEAILAVARAGGIPMERIDASVERILLAKQRFARETRAPEGGESDGAALQIARKAVTLVRNDAGQLPMDPASREKLLVVEFALKALTGAEDQIQGAAPFAESLGRQYRGPVQSLIHGLDPGNAEIEAAVAAAAGCDRILVATQNAGVYSGQARLVRALAASGKPVLAVALRNPYDLMAFPEVKTYLATYGYQPCALQAVSEAITGRLQPMGRLPVTIPGLYPYGHGLATR
ncbi:MAG: beta-N-acetylhexosaminidase [Firmicutes bacterium]|nr:beta-N-acetylhexosaminidase [Bacillota bacterium]